MKKIALGLSLMAVGCSSEAVEPVERASYGVVAGAGFTTFDAEKHGCEDSPNGINCNNYQTKDAVYMTGGPSSAGLSNGDYYFAVLTPGSQNGGFVEGAQGNLSDTVAGGTAGDQGTGDSIENRTFTMRDGEIVYSGSHVWGTSPMGRPILQLFPFDDTSNPGGVYILAICRVGATNPRECKHDAFRIAPGQELVWGIVSGGKYYDRNANGVWDLGEVGLSDWPIEFTDGFAGQLWTDSYGTFTLSLIADEYVFNERVANAPWIQTGNRQSQLTVVGGASATLNPDFRYDVVVVDNSEVHGVVFGNLCVGRGGGRTLGFWSNKNGRALIGSDDLAVLRGLPLVNASGAAFDPTTYAPFRDWLLAGNAVNMAYMLSVQLAAMQMNVQNGFVDEAALVYAPGLPVSNVNGFATIYDLVLHAVQSLNANPSTPDGSPARAAQEVIKNALDAANNDTSFVQPTPDTCPAPVFP